MLFTGLSGRFIAVMVALSCFAPVPPLRANPADMLLFNGRIVTLDGASSINEALAITGDRLRRPAAATRCRSLTGLIEAVSERDELDTGPSFFGEAKEVGSLRPVQKVQVSAELGERRMSTYTNDEGSFKIPSFGKDTPADSVTITARSKATAPSTSLAVACPALPMRRS
jgi:hypothetical protein